MRQAVAKEFQFSVSLLQPGVECFNLVPLFLE